MREFLTVRTLLPPYEVIKDPTSGHYSLKRTVTYTV